MDGQVALVGEIPWTRVASRVGMYLAAAVMPFFTTDVGHPAIGVAVCLAAAALQVPLAFVCRNRAAHLANSVFDSSVVLLLAFVAPSLWYTSLILIVAGSTLMIASIRPEASMLLIGVLIVGMLVITANEGPIGWFPLLAVAGGVLVVAARHGRAFRYRLQENDDRLAQAMHASGSIAMTVSLPSGQILDSTGDVRLVTGWDRDTWCSVPIAWLAEAADAGPLTASLDELQPGNSIDTVIRYQNPGGNRRWLRLSGSAELDRRNGRLLRAMVTDVSEMHKISNALHEQARADRITGLANRHRLEEDLEDRAVHKRDYAYLVIDIRNFKVINNTVGHHIGDLILTMMATRLLNDLDNATAYRLSSDQFAVVLEDICDVADATEIAERLLANCARPYAVGQLALLAPVRIGISFSTTSSAPANTIRKADVALDVAKSNGLSIAFYSDEMKRFTLDNLVLSASIDQALERGELRLYFQPQVDLVSGQTVGAEGLVRWLHPERGVLYPNDFLEALRLSTSFDRFTLAMLEQALQAAEAARWCEPPIRFAVNVELRSLVSPAFADRAIEVLCQHRIGANRIVLEVTESEFAHQIEEDWEAAPNAELQRLREAGFELSIDDFGTGSSSLARLARLPADEVKIDREFIRVLFSGGPADVLVDTIVQLTVLVGMRSIAEGIESIEQVQHLVRSGCRIGQGFLFSEAIPLSEFIGSLHRTFEVENPEPEANTVTPISAARSSKRHIVA